MSYAFTSSILELNTSNSHSNVRVASSFHHGMKQLSHRLPRPNTLEAPARAAVSEPTARATARPALPQPPPTAPNLCPSSLQDTCLSPHTKSEHLHLLSGVSAHGARGNPALTVRTLSHISSPRTQSHRRDFSRRCPHGAPHTNCGQSANSTSLPRTRALLRALRSLPNGLCEALAG